MKKINESGNSAQKKHHIEPLRNKYKALILTFVLDVIFAVASYFIARLIMFYDPVVQIPESYKNIEIAIAVVFLIVVIAMLVFFDCYNTVWKYAGRIEFFKVLVAYFAAFGTLMLFKLVMSFAFDVDIWAPIILLYLLFSAIFSVGMRFISAIIKYLMHVRNWVDEKSAHRSGPL